MNRAFSRSPLGMVGCALALASLAACGSIGGRNIQSGSIATSVTIDKAFVDMPPGGPGVVGVIERHYANSTTQEIVLSNRSHTPGQNMVTATLFGPVKSVTGPENTQANPAITLSAIGAEMRQALPGVPMRVSPYYAQNRYGSFGYAMGGSAQGDTCIYAWQRIRTPDLDSNMTIGQGTITLRLRLCEPNTTEANLLAVMTGMTISSYIMAANWNPYGGAPPIPADLGRLGTTVLPTAQVTPQLAPEPAPASAAPVRRVVRKAPVEAADPVPAADSGRFDDFAAVPPPQL
ncbi:cellulose biosynthesis protein BcsN [Kaistia sp. MMO-174]|uniref:cellulose biosynthesis protein BcsN n=1 Tax=Kaistia sp. MMO-174 TaxID=3081256 RepID=UPI001ACE01C2|nr:cellulose biosynthesis protein BcsN [Hyphomicrobiales bacterium]